jgi:hypothetical protein
MKKTTVTEMINNFRKGRHIPPSQSEGNIFLLEKIVELQNEIVDLKSSLQGLDGFVLHTEQTKQSGATLTTG